MNSREEFIRQVANAIKNAQNDDGRSESFIFGLSAKWGEGKTTFLKGLREYLDKSIIVEINPWK
jgi:predicted KAP-like P-loop ATPase